MLINLFFLKNFKSFTSNEILFLHMFTITRYDDEVKPNKNANFPGDNVKKSVKSELVSHII